MPMRAMRLCFLVSPAKTTTDTPMNNQRRHRTLATLPPRIALAPQRLRRSKKTADPVYAGSEWRTLITRIIAQRGRRCEKCGRSSDENGAPIRVFGDHIVELKDGGPLFDPNNVMLLCGSCHTTKSNQERAKRMARRCDRL
jgi:5-methylcytosine-specific restriction enzyme A